VPSIDGRALLHSSEEIRLEVLKEPVYTKPGSGAVWSGFYATC